MLLHENTPRNLVVSYRSVVILVFQPYEDKKGTYYFQGRPTKLPEYVISG